MARTHYADSLAFLRTMAEHMTVVENEEGHPTFSVYVGSYMSLDPCGRYHHAISPNQATRRCEAFWDSFEKAADRLGGWIETGEGDPTDIYFCMAADELDVDHDDMAMSARGRG